MDYSKIMLEQNLNRIESGRTIGHKSGGDLCQNRTLIGLKDVKWQSYGIFKEMLEQNLNRIESPTLIRKKREQQ